MIGLVGPSWFIRWGGCRFVRMGVGGGFVAKVEGGKMDGCVEWNGMALRCV